MLFHVTFRGTGRTGRTRPTRPATGATRDTLEQLGAKYREMLAMRLEHASGGEDEPAVRRRMAELARRFPGALREIDDLELAVIRDRIGQLEAVLSGEREVAPWMDAMALFHGLARGALRAKRWLAGRKTIDTATAREFEAHVTDATGAAPAGDAIDALAWADDLAGIAAPPRGRVMDLVFARLAAALGMTEDEARRLVFEPRRTRSRPG
jgi:hypothetical protein